MATSELIVIGGGPAGAMAAIAAAEAGAAVTLMERNPLLGKKLRMTGKGRCNVTNDCGAETVLEQVPHNSRFLFGAVTRFPPAAVQSFFIRLGVPLKTERGNRVFPRSDRAADVAEALERRLRQLDVCLLQERAVQIQTKDGRVWAVKGEKKRHPCSRVILATGGKSYPATGSTGDGYWLAGRLGHTVIPPKPSLVPLEIEGTVCKTLQGLTLKNVALTVVDQAGRTHYRNQGELVFAHFGVSGPLVLQASAHMPDFDQNTYRLRLDLKPGLDEKKLDARLLRDFQAQPNRNLQTGLSELLPRAMIPVVLQMAGLPGERKIHSVTQGERRALLEALKGLELTVTGKRPIEEAIVTAGGIRVSEINPATMESKLVSGLYFAGELIDVDGYTGGFNLQIAWATGHLAGISAAAAILQGGKQDGTEV